DCSLLVLLPYSFIIFVSLNTFLTESSGAQQLSQGRRQHAPAPLPLPLSPSNSITFDFSYLLPFHLIHSFIISLLSFHFISPILNANSLAPDGAAFGIRSSLVLQFLSFGGVAPTLVLAELFHLSFSFLISGFH